MNLFVYCCGVQMVAIFGRPQQTSGTRSAMRTNRNRIILQIENMLERVFHVLVHQVRQTLIRSFVNHIDFNLAKNLCACLLTLCESLLIKLFLIQRHVNLLYVFLVFVRHNDESALSNRTLVVKGVVLGERGDAL